LFLNLRQTIRFRHARNPRKFETEVQPKVHFVPPRAAFLALRSQPWGRARAGAEFLRSVQSVRLAPTGPRPRGRGMTVGRRSSGAAPRSFNGAAPAQARHGGRGGSKSSRSCVVDGCRRRIGSGGKTRAAQGSAVATALGSVCRSPARYGSLPDLLTYAARRFCGRIW
jgi:hypothetical protein